VTPWGPTDVQKHTAWKRAGHDLHVIVRGVDVTTRCQRFDDTADPPYAVLIRHNAHGCAYRDEDGHASVEVEYDFAIIDNP
jgi:hypothetical protein